MVGYETGHLLKRADVHRKLTNKSKKLILKRNVAANWLKIIYGNFNMVKNSDKLNMNVFCIKSVLGLTFF